MIIICYGMIKSASTFTYNVINEIMRMDSTSKGLQYLEPKDLSDDLKFNFIDGKTDMRELRETLRNRDSNFFSSRHIVFKTHMPYSYFEDSFDNDEILCVRNYRHPIEVAISLRDAAIKDKSENRNRFDEFDTFDAALLQVPYQIDCFQSWEKSSSFQIYYDELILEPEVVFSELISFFNVSPTLLDVARLTLNRKESLPEYNVAKLGRRFDEFTAEEISEIESEFSNFVDFINSKIS